METMNLPVVSVIIPVYNGERYIGRCLDHLFRQSYPVEKFELIIVDNGSTDNTVRIVESYGLKSRYAGKKGPGAARNAGFNVAGGEIILLIDADCLADPDLIVQHVRAHQFYESADPTVQIIGWSIRGLNTNYWSVCDDFCSWTGNHPLLPPRYVASHPTANLSFRRELVAKGFGFDEELKSGEDYDFCIRLTRAGYKIFFEPKATVSHINRTRFSSFMKHARDWTISEYQLRRKGIIIPPQNNSLRWTLIFANILLGNIIEIVTNSFQAGRIQVLLFLPWIILNRSVYYFYILKAELRFQKERDAAAGKD